jgi:hypothetical protein
LDSLRNRTEIKLHNYLSLKYQKLFFFVVINYTWQIASLICRNLISYIYIEKQHEEYFIHINSTSIVKKHTIGMMINNRIGMSSYFYFSWTTFTLILFSIFCFRSLSANSSKISFFLLATVYLWFDSWNLYLASCTTSLNLWYLESVTLEVMHSDLSPFE